MRTYHVSRLILNIFSILPSLVFASELEIKLEDISGSTQKLGTIQQTLQGTYDEVWDVVTDIAHYPEFMPKNKTTTILEQDKEFIRYSALVDMPWPLTNVEYTSNFYPRKHQRRIDFQMVEGSGKGVKSFYGHWRFEILDEKQVKATYTLFFESEKKYPQWAVNMGLKSTLGQVMKKVQQRILQQQIKR
jgi:ribosome-associated toxin RatA of RatAB toxin-antitoxin module